MSRSTNSNPILRPATLSLAGLALAAIAIVVFAVGPGRAASAATPVASASPTTAPVPSSPASPVASPVAIPDQRAVPTARPTTDPTTDPDEESPSAAPLSVKLDIFDDHDVNVAIFDRTGSLTAAISGTPGDGGSVENYTLNVTNENATTLRLTWIDFPIDNELTLFVDESHGHLVLALVQPEPKGDTDAIAFDRELLLTFDHAVDAGDVEAILQDGLDTAG